MNVMKIFLAFVFILAFLCPAYCADPKRANNEIAKSSAHNWKQISYQADKLIDERAYGEAEKLLNSALVEAKTEEPNGLDTALASCRLGSALYALKHYPDALTKMQQAIDICNKNPISKRQLSILWRSFEAKQQYSYVWIKMRKLS